MEIKRNTYLYPERINNSSFKLKDIFGNSTVVNNTSKLYNLINDLKGKPLSYYDLAEARNVVLNEVEFSFSYFQIPVSSRFGVDVNLEKHYCKNATPNYNDEFYSDGNHGFYGSPASPLFKFHTNIERTKTNHYRLDGGTFAIVFPECINCNIGGQDYIADASLIKWFGERLETFIMRCDIIETGKDILLNGNIYSAIIK